MSTLVQTVLNYKFYNSELLEDALRSAHRSEQDGTHYDGNRGLAHYGTLAIQIAQTHDSIVEKKNTLHDFHTRKHWSKTKNGRARACSSLGIEAYINQSVRQGNQRPSGTVLDNALSAILGAIWLDCEGQEQTTATTRRTIWGVLRSIDVALSSPTSSPACGAETLPILSCQSDTLIDQPGKQTGEADLLLGQEQDHIQYFAKEWFEREIGDVRDISNYYTDFIRESEPDIVEAEGTMLGGNHVWNSSFETASRPSTDCHTLGARSGFSSQNLLTQGTNRNTDWENVSTVEIRNSSNDTDVLITGAKRKRLRSKEDKADLIYQEMLESESRKLTYVSENEAEKLQRFLVHPRLDALEGKTSNALRFLWLTIGNWQTISNFKDQLQLARSGPCVYRQSAISSWVALETYNEICRLDNEGSLNVLLRRYHAMKLCEEEPTSGDSHRYIMVHIPNPMVAGERSTPGNPSVISKAYQTDKLVMKIMPSIQHTSPEFKKVRRRVKLLQKLAMRLGVLVNSYGLGILALLPSDASFGELSLTDNVLTAIDETTFRDFTMCLRQEQGSLLESLSTALLTDVQALLTYSLDCTTEYLVERINLPALSSQPKGLLDLG